MVSGDMAFGNGNNFPFQPTGKEFFCCNEVIVSLQIHPTLGVGAEKPGQTQSNIRRNRPFPGDDFSDAPPGYPNGCCQQVLGDVHGFKEILLQNFSGMNFLWKAGDKCAFKNLFRILATKRLNHNFHYIKGVKYCQVFIIN
jgi:hypothetical protein